MGGIQGKLEIVPEPAPEEFSRVKLGSSAKESLFQFFIEEVKDYAIFLLDPLGIVVSWNKGAARIKGYAAEEIIGKHFSVFYPPEVARAGHCEAELQRAAEEGRLEDEGWRIRKDGERFWANVVITAVRNPAGDLLGFSKVTRDLTERKRAEDRLGEALAGLERKVEERTAGLRTANRRLEKRESELHDAIRARDEFLTVASHELKTPITSLRLQIQMLQSAARSEKGRGPGPARLDRFLDVSLRQVDRLTLLIDELLDGTKAVANKLPLRFARADLRPLCREVIVRLRAQALMSGCEVCLEAPVSAWGNFDRFRIDQVLVNLLTNAFRHAPGSRVEVRLRKVGETAILSVSDQGPGIPAGDRARLFERFERGVGARNLGGLGLGLFISREIVRGHQGMIRVENADSGGARFTVELPTNLP